VPCRIIFLLSSAVYESTKSSEFFTGCLLTKINLVAVTGHNYYFLYNVTSHRIKEFVMKKFSLLLLIFSMGLFSSGQSWTKKYDRVDACNCGMALVSKSGKFGYVSDEGKVLVPLVYDDAMAFSENRAAVMQDGKWGFIDLNGNEFVKSQYTEVYSFHDGLAVVGKGDAYGFVDSTGQVAIPMRYTNARSFGDGVAPVSNQKGFWGYIDKGGKEVISFRFNYATSFSDGVGRVLMGSKWYSIDNQGKLTKEE